MISDEAIVLISDREFGYQDPNKSVWLNLGSQVRNITIRRGKSSDFSDYGIDTATIEFNNHERQFDPNYDNDFQYSENYYQFESGVSPFPPFLPTYTKVNMPWNPSTAVGERRKVKIGFGLVRNLEFTYNPDEIRMNARRSIFTGVSGDWEFSYTPDGDSVASLTVYGNLSDLQQLEMPVSAGSRPEELASVRAEQILAPLSSAEGRWPYSIETSERSVLAENISDENPLAYVNLLAQSEGGAFFSSRTGTMTFDNSLSVANRLIELSNSEIPFASIQVDYGSDLLYNDITLTNTDSTSVNVTNANSINANGRKPLSISNLRTVSSNNELQSLAIKYEETYSTPKFRVTSVAINAQKFDKSIYPVSTAQDFTTASQDETPTAGRFSQIQDDLITTDLEDYVSVSFTPNGIGTPITQTLRVIAINHTITPNDYVIEYALADKRHNTFRLDSLVFGILDENVLN